MAESWVEIHIGTLRGNLRAVRRVLSPRTALMFVVKSNAYGHDARRVAATAAAEGVEWLTVSDVREALAIRQAALDAKILILGAPFAEEAPVLAENGIWTTVVGLEHARALGGEAGRRGLRLPVHLKIDTGMGRMGLLWTTAAAEAAEILRLPGLDVQGLCTHFARVDAETSADTQMSRFERIAAAVDAAAGRRLFRHASNSRALLLRPAWDGDGVRPGILLYGYGASDPSGRFCTRPVLQWKSRVVNIRKVPAHFPVGYFGTYRTPAATTLAIVGLGYADGYLRSLSNRGHVLIRGRRCRVAGRVSMNWLTVDAGPGADAAEGDEVVLIGRQGNQEIWADELAVLCRTIPYEILTGIREGLPRRIVDAPAGDRTPGSGPPPPGPAPALR